MAGDDQQFVGEAFPADGITVGFLQQEPKLDPNKTVLGNVEEGVAEIKALLDQYDAINMRLGEDLSPEEMDKVLSEQGRLQDRIDAVNAWDIDSQLELAMDALRCPPPDAGVVPATPREGRRRPGADEGADLLRVGPGDPLTGFAAASPTGSIQET